MKTSILIINNQNGICFVSLCSFIEKEKYGDHNLAKRERPDGDCDI